MASSLAISGRRKAPEPFAIYASVSNTTGVMCSRAILEAWKAASKQSAGLVAASTGMGLSPFRPKSTCSKSVCSDLVGRPVAGPPRCTSSTTKGSSMMTARFMASDFRQIPGPEVEVTASAPAKEAPKADAAPLISSSH